MHKVIGNVRLAAVLNTKTGKDKVYPVAIRVSFKGTRKYYNVAGIFCKESLWQYFFTTRVPERKSDADKVKEFFTKVSARVAFLEESGIFSFANLENAILQEPIKYSFAYLDEIISHIYREKMSALKLNTAATYKSLDTVIKSCYNKRVKIYDVNASWLKDFENRLYNQGNSPSTIGIRMRALKHVFNTLISMKIISKKLYPFADYTIPNGTRRKLALSQELLDELKQQAKHNKYLNLWLLSYYMQGINFCDMLRLRKSNFEFITGTIRFCRMKTSGRTKFDEEIVIPMTNNFIETISRSIDFQKWKKACGNPYLLPYLDDSMDEKTKWRKTRNLTRLVNDKLKEFCPDGKLSTYSARHTFTCNMLRVGASIEAIAQCLGHTSTSTTRYYIEGLDYTSIAKFTEQL